MEDQNEPAGRLVALRKQKCCGRDARTYTASQLLKVTLICRQAGRQGAPLASVAATTTSKEHAATPSVYLRQLHRGAGVLLGGAGSMAAPLPVLGRSWSQLGHELLLTSWC